jgi:hypothetical protein
MEEVTAQKPQNLVEAESALRAARLRYHIAKSNRAMREAREDVEFWANKVTMLSVMFEKGMLRGRSSTAVVND